VTFSIFGSGFGLYGYLPALIELCGQRVVLPARYRAHLQSRDDVGYLADSVEWARDDADALARSDAVIITRRPEDQVRWVDRYLKLESVQKLLLEKPLAPNPAAARQIIESLEYSGKMYRIAYMFRYTDWGHRLLASRRLPPLLEFDWRFEAHHYALGLEASRIGGRRSTSFLWYPAHSAPGRARL
jgi:predicted dehydrogenase